MRSKLLVGGVAVLVFAIFLGGSGKSQTKSAKDASKLQKLLSRFPQADADGNGILTEREAEEYRRTRQKEKTKASTADAPASATLSDLQYGSHERNRLDLWRAKSEQPAPVLVFFHGGSFRAGDKAIVAERPILRECLAAGISVVSANYRFSSDAPYPASMVDGARVVQFVRSRAREWNIDPQRIAVSGSSAGATLALWIALHDDLADENSSDPVLRQATRVSCASPHSGSAGLTSDYFQKQAGVTKQGAALWQFFGAATQAEFDLPAKQDLAREASPLTHVSSDDPPLFLTYQGDPEEAPFAADAAQSNWIHHVCLGLPLKAKYDELGRECDLYYKSKPAAMDAEIEFLKKHLFAARQVLDIAPQAAALREIPAPNAQPTEQAKKRNRSAKSSADNAPEWVWKNPQMPAGTRFKTFKSATLHGQEVSYLLWTPPGFDDRDQTKRYPVAYFLHGGGGNYTHIPEAFLPQAADAIQKGTLPPFIGIVVNGLPSSFYADSQDGRTPVESIMINELLPHVDATYRTNGVRLIEGFSMGGRGAAFLAFKYPDKFCGMADLAGAIHDWSFFSRMQVVAQLFEDEKEFAAAWPFNLARQNTAAINAKFPAGVLLVVGDQDTGRGNTYEWNLKLHETLDDLRIKNEICVVKGVKHSYQLLAANTEVSKGHVAYYAAVFAACR